MKFRLLFALVLCAQTLFGQSDSLEQIQINKDVWYNFMKAYKELDASLFNQIHTDDVLRVIVDQEMMMVGSEYLDRNLETFNRWNANRIDQRIEFSFLSRTRKDDWAYEVGIFKLTRKNGWQSQSYYGKFNVTLKKINGIWKIKIDADTNEDGSIGEETFQKGAILY